MSVKIPTLKEFLNEKEEKDETPDKKSFQEDLKKSLLKFINLKIELEGGEKNSETQKKHINSLKSDVEKCLYEIGKELKSDKKEK